MDMTNRQMDVNMAQRKPLHAWEPDIGDWIIIHGWVSHWFGVVSKIDRTTNSVEVIRAGLPAILFSYAEDEMVKNTIKINVTRIRNSRTKYSVVKNEQAAMVWYVP